MKVSRRRTWWRREPSFTSQRDDRPGSLLVTLLVIGFGPATGPGEGLRSLDLVPGAIAVFGLGFGADSPKNMITRNSG